MSITQAELDKLNDEHCPAKLTLSGEPNDGSHCACWWDGDGCCRCDFSALTDEQKKVLGVE